MNNFCIFIPILDDKDKKYNRIAGLTPQTFYQEHVPFHIENLISVINDPRQVSPLFPLFLVLRLPFVKITLLFVYCYLLVVVFFLNRNEYYRTYTVSRLGNVVGGRPVLYLNLPIDDLKRISMQTISNGDPVWFGCDVGKEFHRKVLDKFVFVFLSAFSLYV